jgi:hypothetical protein
VTFASRFGLWTAAASKPTAAASFPTTSLDLVAVPCSDCPLHSPWATGGLFYALEHVLESSLCRHSSCSVRGGQPRLQSRLVIHKPCRIHRQPFAIPDHDPAPYHIPLKLLWSPAPARKMLIPRERDRFMCGFVAHVRRSNGAHCILPDKFRCSGQLTLPSIRSRFDLGVIEPQRKRRLFYCQEDSNRGRCESRSCLLPSFSCIDSTNPDGFELSNGMIP